jgi:nitroreductase
MHVDEAIRQRRTHKHFAGGEVPEATLRELLELARWAPTHGYTEPWRFVVIGHASLGALREAALAALDGLAKPGDEEAIRRLRGKRDKLARRLEGAGAVVVVSWRRAPDDQALDREDYAATCCAIQNLLLGATARGLVGLWSTGAVLQAPALRAFYGLDEGEGVAGVVFLGWPERALQGRRYRELDAISRWI